MRALLLASALAQEAPPPDPAEVLAAWDAVDRNARAMSSIGLGASILGPPAMLVGFGLTIGGALSNGGPSPVALGVLYGGVGATLAGPPLLAGGSLRSARALGIQGAWPDDRAAYATWGLWGASLGLVTGALMMQNSGEGEVAGVLAVAGTLAYGGAVVAGGVQLGRNGEARRALHPPLAEVVVAPNGLAVRVAF